MKRTDKEKVTKRLQEAYDADYYNSVFRQINYAFGEPWAADSAGGSNTSGSMPYYPDTTCHFQEIGQSRRILNAQFIGLSRVMYNDPEPTYQALDKINAEARKGFMLARWRGDNYGAGCWADEEHRAFMDGDGTGLGFLQLGLRTGVNGYQMVTARHSPTLLTLGDRHERSPDRWRYVCFVHYMPADDAMDKYGSKIKDSAVVGFDGAEQGQMEFVRLFEYFDMGSAKEAPTRKVLVGEFDGDVVEDEENPFGCIPFSYYLHFYAPGMRRPVGRILLQMSTQEALNEIEGNMRWAMKHGKPMDIIAEDEYDPKDLQTLKTGKGSGFVRRLRPKKDAGDNWERVNGMEISQSTLAYYNMLNQQFNTDSSTNEYERGGMPAGDRTATEVQALTTRSSTQGLWSIRQLIQFRERTFEKASKIAAQFDREPVDVEMFGALVPVNQPGVPESSCEQFLEQPCKVLISEESMDFHDLETRRSKRLAYLFSLVPLIQLGTINVAWFTEEVLKAGGEKDVRAAMSQNQMMAPPMPGQETSGAEGAGAMALNNNMLRGMQF